MLLCETLPVDLVAAARSLQAKRLAEQEEEELAKAAKGKTQQKWNYNEGARKVTAFELQQQREAEEAARAEAFERAKLHGERFTTEDEYAK